MSSKIDPSVKYQKSHEWARASANEITVGISDHAQEALSDLVYIELPRVGSIFTKGAVFGVVESVKAASDVYMPVGGVITAINSALEKSPEIINKDPYNTGWLIKVRPDNPTEINDLLNAESYEQYLREEEH
jgi:glycine cleavage system H protein